MLADGDEVASNGSQCSPMYFHVLADGGRGGDEEGVDGPGGPSHLVVAFLGWTCDGGRAVVSGGPI